MLQVGQTIYDRYQLKEKLGHNAGRQTWLAADLSAQLEPVILKLLAFGDQVEWDHLKLFEREAQILRHLDHPRIPKYRDYFSIDDRILWFGLVQDYIPGTSLKQLIQDGKRFSEAEVRRIAIEVLDILTYLHELNPPVLHRDIKPSNLILGTDENVYLVDFGAVQDRASIEGATFTVIGTYGYTPIEQFGGRAVPASDLYALGSTLIHLLTGVSPADLPQRNLQIQWRNRATLSAAVGNWLEQLTHPDVEQRFLNARYAIHALNTETARPSFARLERPRDTRVKFAKAKHRLEIIIPKPSDRGSYSNPKTAGLLASGLLILMLLTMVLFEGVGLSISLAWIVLSGFLVFVLFVSPWFERTYIRFDRQEFVIERQRFNATSHRLTGITPDIREVRGELNSGQILITSGPYRSGYRTHSFGEELTDFERAWLLKEIRSWLRLKSEVAQN